MSPSVQAVLAQPLVEQFRLAYPEVSLSIMEGFSGHVQEWLSTGQLDIAILYRTPYNGMLCADALLTDELFLLGPVGDPARVGEGPIPLEDLHDIPLILPNRQHGLRILLDECFLKIGVTPNVQLEMDAMASTLSLIEHNIGYYTVLSYSCAHSLIAQRRIRYWRITKPMITRTLVVTSSTQRPSTSASRIPAGLRPATGAKTGQTRKMVGTCLNRLNTVSFLISALRSGNPGLLVPRP